MQCIRTVMSGRIRCHVEGLSGASWSFNWDSSLTNHRMLRMKSRWHYSDPNNIHCKPSSTLELSFALSHDNNARIVCVSVLVYIVRLLFMLRNYRHTFERQQRLIEQNVGLIQAFNDRDRAVIDQKQRFLSLDHDTRRRYLA